MSCSICSKIAPSIVAVTGRDESLPAETRPLKSHKDHYAGLGTDAGIWECPECRMLYIYTTETAFTGSGSGDRDTLERMTREQSDVVHAMLACTADPAATEDALFALPEVALDRALTGAWLRDREFVALFIPRLVHECTKRPPSPYYSDPRRDTLHALIKGAPSYAREVLAVTSALPPELRNNLGDLEVRCQQALSAC